MIKLSRMPKPSSMRLRLALTCAVSVLAACSQQGSASNTTQGDKSLADAPPPPTALPLATGPAPAYGPAPAADALPPAPRARLGRTPPSDQYAYLNQAYAFSQSLADAPPDYTYDYQGERPWVWQSPDGYYRVAEQLPMGVRYFYYAPGASQPYLVQDPQYSYGYSGGMLTVLYGPDGEVLPDDVQARQSQAAGLYLAWAAGLYAAARQEQHFGVSQDRWDAERRSVYADQARWNQAQQRNAAWADYSQAHQNDQAHWVDQRYVRAAEAARFAEAVHDQTALAHAQQAASEARTVAQSHVERPPGPAAQGGDERRAPGAPAVSQSRPTASPADAQRAQASGHGEAAHSEGQGPAERSPGPAVLAKSERRQPSISADRTPGPAAGLTAASQHQEAAPRQPTADHAGAQRAAQPSASRPTPIQAQQVQTHQVQVQQAHGHDPQGAPHRAPPGEAAQPVSSEHRTTTAHREASEPASPQPHAQKTPPAAESRKPETGEAAHPVAPAAKPKPEPHDRRP